MEVTVPGMEIPGIPEFSKAHFPILVSVPGSWTVVSLAAPKAYAIPRAVIPSEKYASVSESLLKYQGVCSRIFLS